MADTLCVGIDLGCDTLKLSYAYYQDSKKDSKIEPKIVYGKMEAESNVLQAAIPAVAYYDGVQGWVFGNDVEMGEEKPFVNIVKIKALLSLLYPKRGSKYGKEVYPNADYYYDSDRFPKFYFPNTNPTLENFPELVKDGRVFRAGGYTPQKVCREFFGYVKKIIEGCVKQLSEHTKNTFSTIRYSLVHPSYAGKKYVDELSDLVHTALGSAPYKVMNSARALSMFAYSREAVKGEEGILLFDMGEETISVAKCFLNGSGKVVVEAEADHSAPMRVGGIDVDRSIADDIEEAIKDRETVGSPSAGTAGHIQEEGLLTKQYLFLREIKKAKMMLSMPRLNEVFTDGVPVSIHRDLYIQRTLTGADLKRAVGITKNNRVARKVLDYIDIECKLPVNNDVSKIFLTGGLTETFGFVDYLKKQLEKRFEKRFSDKKPSIEVCTFDDNINDGDNMKIQSYEDSVYAPSVGAAIVALKNYNVSAGLTYSYGTYAGGGGKEKFLEIFADRGTEYDDQKRADFTTDPLRIIGTISEEFFSIRLSKSSIQARKGNGEVSYLSNGKGEYVLVIGERGTDKRKKVEEKFQLKGQFEEDAKIRCCYKGKEIERIEPRIRIQEGIHIHPGQSEAEPFVVNVSEKGSKAMATFKDGSIEIVELCEIQVGFSKVGQIKVEKS